MTMKDAEVGVDAYATTRLAYHPTSSPTVLGFWGADVGVNLTVFRWGLQIDQFAGSNRRIGFKLSKALVRGLDTPTNL